MPRDVLTHGADAEAPHRRTACRHFNPCIGHHAQHRVLTHAPPAARWSGWAQTRRRRRRRAPTPRLRGGARRGGQRDINACCEHRFGARRASRFGSSKVAVVTLPRHALARRHAHPHPPTVTPHPPTRIHHPLHVALQVGKVRRQDAGRHDRVQLGAPGQRLCGRRRRGCLGGRRAAGSCRVEARLQCWVQLRRQGWAAVEKGVGGEEAGSVPMLLTAARQPSRRPFATLFHVCIK